MDIKTVVHCDRSPLQNRVTVKLNLKCKCHSSQIYDNRTSWQVEANQLNVTYNKGANG